MDAVRHGLKAGSEGEFRPGGTQYQVFKYECTRRGNIADPSYFVFEING